MYQLAGDMFNMYLAKEFYMYLESDPKEVEGMPFYPVFEDGL